MLRNWANGDASQTDAQLTTRLKSCSKLFAMANFSIHTLKKKTMTKTDACHFSSSPLNF